MGTVDWKSLDQSLGSGEDLRAALDRLARVPNWDAVDRESAAEDLWSYIQKATLDLGAIRDSAYPTTSELVRIARGNRSTAEQSIALLFVLDAVFGPLLGAPGIPPSLVGDFQSTIVTINSMAEKCIEDKSLKVGNRRVAGAAVLLSKRQLVLARLAYGLAATERVALSCPVCSSDIEFAWLEGEWVGSGLNTNTLVRDLAIEAKLSPISSIGTQGELGDDFEGFSALGRRFACHGCGRETDVWALAVADILPRCPLARTSGWTPS